METVVGAIENNEFVWLYLLRVLQRLVRRQSLTPSPRELFNLTGTAQLMTLMLAREVISALFLSSCA